MRPSLLVLAACLAAALPASADDRKLNFADFETPIDQRPVSSRGGAVTMSTYMANPQKAVKVTGMPDATPPTPALKMTARDGSNRAIAFEYELTAGNDWAGVAVEIHGLPDKDGTPQPEDASGYSHLTLQVFTPEPTPMRVEFVSRGLGKDLWFYPQFTFHTKAGFNTYDVPVKNAVQPGFVTDRVQTKDILKKLTAVTVGVYCENCKGTKGLVVIDNVAFEK
jgi:hypothetical protein